MAKNKVRVSRKQVDAAKAEVKAFTVAGLNPDPLVVRIAEAGCVRSKLSDRASGTVGKAPAHTDRIAQ